MHRADNSCMGIKGMCRRASCRRLAIIAVVLSAACSAAAAWGQGGAGSCAELSKFKDSGRDASGALTDCIAASGASLELEPGVYTIAKEVVVERQIEISTRGVPRAAGPCGVDGRKCAALFRSPDFAGSPPPAPRAEAAASGAALLRLTGAKVLLHHLEAHGVKGVLGALGKGGPLIAISGCRGCAVEALVLRDGFGESALLVERSRNVSIHGSLFDGNGSQGALTSGVSVRASSDVDITENLLKNSSKFDINVISCADCEVARNVMWHTRASQVAAVAALRVVGSSVSVHDNFAECGKLACSVAFALGSTAERGAGQEGGSSVEAFNNVASNAASGFQFGLRTKIDLVDNYALGTTGMLGCPTTGSHRYAKLRGANISQRGSTPRLSDIVEARVSLKALSEREQEGCLSREPARERPNTPALSGREAFLSSAAEVAFRNVLGRAPTADESAAAALKLAQAAPFGELVTGISALKEIKRGSDEVRVALPGGGQPLAGVPSEGRAPTGAEIAQPAAAGPQAGAMSVPVLAPPAAVSLVANSVFGAFDLRISQPPAGNIIRQFSVAYRSSRPPGCTDSICPASAIAPLFPQPATAWSWNNVAASQAQIALASDTPELCAFVRVRHARALAYSAPIYRYACHPVPSLPTVQPQLALDEIQGRFVASLPSVSQAGAIRQYTVAYLPELPSSCTEESCPGTQANELFGSQQWLSFGSNNSITLSPETPQRCAVIRARSVLRAFSGSPSYASRCFASPSLSTSEVAGRLFLSIPNWGSARQQWQYSAVSASSLPQQGSEGSLFPATSPWEGSSPQGQLLGSGGRCVVARVRAVSSSGSVTSPVTYLSACVTTFEIFTSNLFYADYLDPESRFLDGPQLVLALPRPGTSGERQRVLYNIEPAERFLTAAEMGARQWSPPQELVTDGGAAGAAYLPVSFGEQGERSAGCVAIRYRRAAEASWSYLSQCADCAPPRIAQVYGDKVQLDVDAGGAASPEVAVFQAAQRFQRAPFAPQRGGWTPIATTSRPWAQNSYVAKLSTLPEFDQQKPKLIRYRQRRAGCGESPYQYYFTGQGTAQVSGSFTPVAQPLSITMSSSRSTGLPVRYDFSFDFQPWAAPGMQRLRLEYSVTNLPSSFQYLNQWVFGPDTTLNLSSGGDGITRVTAPNQAQRCIHARARAVYLDQQSGREFRPSYKVFKGCAQ